MKLIKKILRNKRAGVGIVCLAFFLSASAWFLLPKTYASVLRYQKEMAKATVPVNLSLEEKKKIEKEILELENSIRSSNKKGADNYASQYILLGEKFEKLGYRGKAIKTYQNAIREDGKSISAYTHLGALSKVMENYSVARNAFRAAIDLHPSDPNLYPSLAYVYLDGMRDMETARGVFLEGLIRTDNNLELIKEYVPFLEKVGEYSEAKLYQQEIIKKEPKTLSADKKAKNER